MNLRKLIALLLCALPLTASFLPSAHGQAAERDVTERDTPAGFSYWNDSFLVMTGSAPEFCAGGPPPMLPGLEITRPNGSTIWRTRGNTETTVYEIPTIAPDRLDLIQDWVRSNCDAEPYASGTTLLRSKFRFDLGGIVHVRNGLTGVLTSADGERVRVNTFARANVEAATGALIEVIHLRANVTNSAPA